MTRDEFPISASLHRILQCVRERTGLCFRPAQFEQTAAAVARAMRRAGESEATEYTKRLETNLATLDDLIAELVVGETYFFRLPEQFEFIRETLARKCQDRQTTSRPLRVWSAGCATGEEPYSLAILLREMGLLDRAHILATDISRLALDRARQGRYREWSFRGADAQRSKQHVTADGDGFILREEIRRTVHFSYLNLAWDVYPSFVTGTRDLDLILCRNVLIYLDRDTIGRVARRLFDSLAPGGWLITAATDPPLDQLAPFEAVHARGGIYYRRPAADGGARNTPSRPEAIADHNVATERAGTASSDDVVAESEEQPGDWPPARREEQLPGLDEIRQSLLAGHYEHVIAMTEARLTTPAACVLHVKALSNDNAIRAERTCRRLVAHHPLSAELQYLHAVLLMECRRTEDALAATRKTLYLDRTLAIAHFTLGTLARRLGDTELARRAFRNAREMCRKHPAESIVRFADDETYSSLIRAVELQLASLGEITGDSP